MEEKQIVQSTEQPQTPPTPENYVAPNISAPNTDGEKVRYKKNAVDFVAIIIGVVLLVIRFRGGAELLSYIGVFFILVGLFAPLKSNKCKHCLSYKDIKAPVCSSCGKRAGTSLAAVLGGIILFAIWIFIEVCII